MQNDPLAEWQKLTENYSKMYDDELLQLAVDSDDLTEQARQVLSDEMRKRDLALPRAGDMARRAPDPMTARAAVAPGVDPGAPELVADTPEGGEENDRPHDYTWKTVLCECETSEEALQLAEVLRRAGIESWIEGPGGSYSPYSQLDQKTPRVLVAADRFDEAQGIAAQPVPEEIVEQSKMQVPEFEAPVCPKCGAGDPVLEGVDPFNTWLCEACENEWTEEPVDSKGDPKRAES